MKAVSTVHRAQAVLLDLHWTRTNRWGVAVSRRPDVAYLDSFIGPKW